LKAKVNYCEIIYNDFFTLSVLKIGINYMNFLKKRLSTSIFLILLSFGSFAQIDLTMPVNRMVYQRNQQNIATIYIGGSFSGQIEKIEARLTTLDGTGNPKSPLEETAWTNIVNSPSKGNFLSSLSNIKGGWYRLEVRAIQNNLPIGEISTIKVGVGEVIVAAGQSNTQGEFASDPYKNIFYKATDDRVNSVNLLDYNSQSTFKYPEISHLEANSTIAPTGKHSWCWGPLGDEISKRWGVPVIFFNAAIGNSNITAWRAGAEFSTTEFDPFGRYDFTKGEPFIQLKKTLNYYCSLMGIRTILWQQGETDNGNFGGTGASAEVYTQNLIKVINFSRTYTDKDISWVIAKTSFQNTGGFRDVNPTLIEGQQKVIDTPNFNVFAGPNTDLIQPSAFLRADGVHFWGDGLKELANGWFAALDAPNFKSNSKPQAATPPQLASLGNCVNNNQITAQLPNGYTEYAWYTDEYKSVTTNQSITATNSKLLIPYMKDGSGKNYVFSPPINFTPAKLEITTDRSTTLCDGETVNIIANTFNNNFNWDNGVKTKAIPFKETTNITLSVNTQDVYGCVASATKSFNIKVNPLPVTPKIISDSSPSICEGFQVTLRPENKVAGLENYWSNETFDETTSIKTSGIYTLRFKDKNLCESLVSNPIEVVVNPNPTTPNIVPGGPTTFCADKFVSLATEPNANFEWYIDNNKSAVLNTQIVNASLPGQYTVAALNKFGCRSPFSSALKISTWALPDSPIISKSGETVFCSGNSVELKASSALTNLVWRTSESNIVSTDTKISITSLPDAKVNSNTTYYSQVTDEKGCTSPPSEKVLVAVRANPSLPRIERAGTFTLEAKAPILGLDGTSYDWYFLDKAITSKEQAIKVNQPGNYSVRAKIDYKIPNGDNLVCYSGISSLFDYFENPSNVFSIFPNPTRDGRITLETKEDFTSVQLLLFTPMGQVIFEKTVDIFNNRKILNLSDLPNGEYKLRMKAGNTEITKSLIIGR
jgi:Secretion system C-terminal sorting domain/Carbohydrate esterase, sialic acid-specific acetylesterase/Ig-like domain CHU_C associated